MSTGGRLLLAWTGIALLLLAGACARPRRRHPPAPARTPFELGLARLVGRVNGPASRLAAMGLPGRPDTPGGLALVGGATRAGRVLAMASPENPAASLPGLRLVGACLGIVTTMVVALLVGATALPLGPPLISCGALAPDALIAAAARRAEESVRRVLPEILDLLAAAARAGLSLEQSLGLAAQHCDEPLAGLIRRVAARQGAGQGAATALRVEADRTRVDGLMSLAAVVERNHQLGLPLEAPLSHLAAAARAEAHAAALARAGRAVPLAGVLTAVVIAPACVAALAAPVIGGILGGGVM